MPTVALRICLVLRFARARPGAAVRGAVGRPGVAALLLKRIATSHYARTARQGNRYRLLKGMDCDKDQSYVLYTLRQGQLGRVHRGGVGAAGSSRDVVAKDLHNDVLVVALGHEHLLLMSRAPAATASLSWVGASAPAPPCACRAKMRYRQPD